MKRINDLQARNSAPGSKAGPRREWVHARWQQLLNHGSSDESTALETTAPEEYTYQDAVLEELMGNTSHLTSQPTPEPVYLGHRHRQYYNTVADQMDVYRESIQTQMQTTDGKALLDPSAIAALLPSDKQIANVVRAYRDRNGTRRQPIGIVMALQHLLQDLGVPTGALGEYSYTSLLTCCRTPKEARRIFQLMRDNNHEVSSYSWSILVDIYAKMGDFEGCENVMKEMATHGHAPTLAAYTSLLSACYKVCSDAGRIPHAVRAKAGKFGWEKWQEMRIIGIEPDVMAYGAILRLCAARGLPERAIGLLEDMERFEVKPTTLCYSSALRAVAKSHETAIRFENGDSKRNLRRESIAAHHGKMARQIVIMAETVEVDQDDGFVSALMLCSAAAGDSATAKAVFLASEIRRMDNLRRIGSANVFADSSSATRKELVEGSAHTANQESISPSFGSELTEQPKSRHAAEFGKSTPSGGIKRNENFGEREYGTDTRVVSALMHASAQAMGDNGIGTIWAGRDNAGYLCENSLRLITTRWEPKYRKAGNPGVSSTKVGLGALKYVDERAREEEPMVGKRKKFRGLYVDEEALNFGDVTEEGTFSTSATERVSSPEAGDLFSDDDSNFDMDMQQLSMGGDNPIHIDNKLLVSGFLASKAMPFLLHVTS
jgi:pentatricopeptide repeat protein